MSKEQYRKYLETSTRIASLGFLLSISLNAFSRKTKREMLERDNFSCVDCGATTHIEGAHNNHDKNDPDYDSVHQGDCRCVRCHYMQHLNNRDFPEDIGLKDINWNDSAIASLYERMPDEWKQSVPPPDCTDEEMRTWNEWIYGDKDYWVNYDYNRPIEVKDWPKQQELPNFTEVYNSRKKRI